MTDSSESSLEVKVEERVYSYQEKFAVAVADIAEFRVRAEIEQKLRDAKLAYEDETRPEPPHPHALWQRRARHVFLRLIPFGLTRMAWHQPTTWPWAAGTEAGQTWLEREIQAMEKLADHHERQVRLTRARLLEEGVILTDGTRPTSQSRTASIYNGFRDTDGDDEDFCESLREREQKERKLRELDEEGLGRSRKLKVLHGGKVRK